MKQSPEYPGLGDAPTIGDTTPTEAQTSEEAMQPPPCEHYWASVHEPGHRLYWIRQCMLCHRIDWDELDADIADLAREFPLPETDRLRAALERITNIDTDLRSTPEIVKRIAREALDG